MYSGINNFVFGSHYLLWTGKICHLLEALQDLGDPQRTLVELLRKKIH